MARLGTALCAAFVLVACTDNAAVKDAPAASGTLRVPQARAAGPWVATPDSLGPIAVGSLYSVVARAFGGKVRPVPKDPEEQACDYAELPGLPQRVELMVFGDTIVRIDIDIPGVLTRQGLGVGSPESALLTGYRGQVRVESHPYDGPAGHYVVVTPGSDSIFRMIFETDGKVVQSYRIGLRRAVDLIEGCS
jgi:hypothetical protein